MKWVTGALSLGAVAGDHSPPSCAKIRTYGTLSPHPPHACEVYCIQSDNSVMKNLNPSLEKKIRTKLFLTP
jgi:DNA primase large subunit